MSDRTLASDQIVMPTDNDEESETQIRSVSKLLWLHCEVFELIAFLHSKSSEPLMLAQQDMIRLYEGRLGLLYVAAAVT